MFGLHAAVHRMMVNLSTTVSLPHVTAYKSTPLVMSWPLRETGQHGKTDGRRRLNGLYEAATEGDGAGVLITGRVDVIEARVKPRPFPSNPPCAMMRRVGPEDDA